MNMLPKTGGWFIFAMLALLAWGVWGFLPRLSLNHLNPKSVLVYEVVGSIIVGAIVLFLLKFKPQVSGKGMIFAVLTGVLGMLGALFFVIAVSKGKTSVVVTTSALYPLVTVMLAFAILKEPITFKQGLGIFFALIAIILFNS